MKHTLLAAAILTASIPLAQAEEIMTEAFCMQVNGLAESIMDARQRRKTLTGRQGRSEFWNHWDGESIKGEMVVRV